VMLEDPVQVRRRTVVPHSLKPNAYIDACVRGLHCRVGGGLVWVVCERVGHSSRLRANPRRGQHLNGQSSDVALNTSHGTHQARCWLFPSVNRRKRKVGLQVRARVVIWNP